MEEARALLEAELSSRDGTEDAVDSHTRRHFVSQALDPSAAAPLWKRFVAGTFDYGGTLTLLTGVNFLLFVTVSARIADLIGYASILAWIVYILFKDAMPKYGFGKRLMGIRVIQVADGEPCSAPQSLLRNLFLSIWLVDWAFALGTHGRRLGDRAAGTYVVEV